MSPWRRRQRPWVLVLAPLIPLAILVIGLLATRPDRRDPREGSREAPGPPVSITRTPISYAITYRVEDGAGDKVTITTDRFVVRRPFESSLTAYSGPPPGQVVLNEQVSRLGRVMIWSPAAATTVIDAPPALAGFDQRVDPLLSDALSRGALVQRERREVAGRSCQVYRAKGALISGLGPFDPNGRDYLDACLDEAGLVLEEVVVTNGTITRRRLAALVEEGIEHPPEAFRIDLTPTLAVRDGGGVTRAVTPTAEPPGEFFVLDTPPDGFVSAGRYAVVPPQGTVFGDPAQRLARLASVADVWTRGPDYLMIDRGGTLGGDQPFAKDPFGRPVDVGSVGQGELIPHVRASEVRVTTPTGYVRVVGTLPPDRLVEIARTLRRVQGNGQLGT